MEPGDLACFVADGQTRVVVNSLGQLRKELAIKLGHIEPGVLNFCWVEEFPLFDEDEETGQPTPCHHPFTCPHPDDLGNLESKPLEVRARAYDLVLNGFEVGGGSIRIHQRELQERVFTAIGITAEEAESKFSFPLGSFALWSASSWRNCIGNGPFGDDFGRLGDDSGSDRFPENPARDLSADKCP